MNIAKTLAIEQQLIKIYGLNYKERDIPSTLRSEVGKCRYCGTLSDERKSFRDGVDEPAYEDWCCEGCYMRNQEL